jgi:hypothetical protein
LENRLLPSVLSSCPILVGGDNLAPAQAAAQSASSPTDSPEVAETSISETATVCPQTGETISPLDVDAGYASGPTDVAPKAGQAASSNAVAPGKVSAEDLGSTHLASPSFLANGEILAEEPATPVLSSAEAGASYIAASAPVFNADEPELSWVDQSTSPDHDSGPPSALLAQADESGAQPTWPVSTYQLVPDFQPLDDSSPFLVPTLRTVAVQSSKPEAPASVSSLSASVIDQTQDENGPTGIEASAGPDNEVLLPATGASHAGPDRLLEPDQENAAVNPQAGDGYIFATPWHPAVSVALPLAGLVFAFGVCQVQRPSVERVASDKLRREPTLPT